MRIKLARLIVVLVILLNTFALHYIWKLLTNVNNDSHPTALENKFSDLHFMHKDFSQFVETSLTLVIRRYEFFENDIPGTVKSFHSVFPNLKIIIVSDTQLYPTLDMKELDEAIGNVKILNMQLQLANTLDERNPLYHIHTRYILFVPDSTRIISEKSLQNMFREFKKQPENTLVSAAISSSKLVECLNVQLNVREWSIQYDLFHGDLCDAVKGKHVILVESHTLKALPEPFMLPFPDALYIQTAAKNLKVKLMINEALFGNGHVLYTSNHAQWKLQQLEQTRQRRMHSALSLKKVTRETGSVEWFGCTRESSRCFGSVLGDVPQYLWQGKWTPPCCMEGLRRTALHVLGKLDVAGVRYWLEGGSLLGAMRLGDILPWDYDVDLGIYRDDVSRCSWLRDVPKVDDEGFVWEKATEGDFYRVQFSQTNHLHVDLFPFYSHNGTMTKETWFPTHRQDCEFPEHFLHPMASIEFLGRQVPAPNNIRDFLELKFGKGAIENPQYPNPQKLKFSDKEILTYKKNIELDDSI